MKIRFLTLICVLNTLPLASASAITAEVARKCEALSDKVYPPRVIGNPAAGSMMATARKTLPSASFARQIELWALQPTTPPRITGIGCGVKGCLIKFQFVEIFHLLAGCLPILPKDRIATNKKVQFSTEKAAQCILR
jgi:hypothetical protein